MVRQLRLEYWIKAFAQGLDVGVLFDGLYNPQQDSDILLMYCMGEPI